MLDRTTRHGIGALMGAMLLTQSAAAQSYLPFPSPPAVNLSGANGNPGSTGKSGTNEAGGNPGAALLRELGFPWTGGGSSAAVSAISNGGKVGTGGNGTQGGGGSGGWQFVMPRQSFFNVPATLTRRLGLTASVEMRAS